MSTVAIKRAYLAFAVAIFDTEVTVVSGESDNNMPRYYHLFLLELKKN
jgi:hypothetical protein